MLVASRAACAAILAENPDRFSRTLAEKLLVYATGRPMTLADRPSIDAVVGAAKKNGLGLRSMIHAVTASEMFLRP